MKITSNLKKAVEDIYNDSNYNVESVSLGHKNKDGELSIVVRVKKKKPLSELNENEVIQSTIEIDGEKNKTDVMEDPD